MTDESNESAEKKAKHESARLLNQPPPGYPETLCWPPQFTYANPETGPDNYPVGAPFFSSEKEAADALAAATDLPVPYGVYERRRGSLQAAITRRDDSDRAALRVFNESVRPLVATRESALTAARTAYHNAERALNEAFTKTEKEAADAYSKALVFDAEGLTPARIKEVTRAAANAYEAACKAARQILTDGVSAAQVAYDKAAAKARATCDTAGKPRRDAYEAARTVAREAFEARSAEIEKQAEEDARAAYKVVPVSWRTRMQRTLDAQYQSAPYDPETEERVSIYPVWHGTYFVARAFDTTKDHFVAVSVNDSTLLSYVSDNAKGQRGIRTPITPGKYLRRFYSGALTDKEIAFYAAWQTTGAKPNQYSDAAEYVLTFHDTPDGIERAYRYGPSSCMDARHSFDTDGVSPVRVYGAGDLAVVTLHAKDSPNDVLGRALVWPAKKAMGRIYPAEGEDAHAEIKSRLVRAGYKSVYADNSLFDGARLLRLRVRPGVYVMPYVDIFRRVNDKKTHFELHRRGDLLAESTNGTIQIDEPRECPHCNKEVGPSGVRLYANTTHRSADVVYAHESCWREIGFLCAGSSRRYINSVPHTTVEHGGVAGVYSNAFLAENAVFSDISKRWFFGTAAVTAYTMDASGRRIRMALALSETAEHCGMCDASGNRWLKKHLRKCAISGVVFADFYAHEYFADVCRTVGLGRLAAHLNLSGDTRATARAIHCAEAGIPYTAPAKQAA